MTTTTVDVMLPFYGDAARLQIAVASVLAQDRDDFRLVCVDDRAPDPEAGDWVRSLRDPRLHYVSNAHNLGLAANFNRCVDLVTAERFVMMGADDVMLPDYLDTVLKLADAAPRAAMIQPGVNVIDEVGDEYLPLADRVKAMVRPRVRGTARELSGEFLARSLTRADWAYFPSLLWRSDVVKHHRFNERYPIALDLALMLDIALSGGSMVVDDHVVFQYRRHRSSESATTASDGSRFSQELELFADYRKRFAEAGWRAAHWEARAHIMTRLNAGAEALGALRSGRLDRFARLASFLVR